MKYKLDLHTHTIASGHAYATLLEMAKAAADIGIKTLGIAEHGPNMPGSCDLLYFTNYHAIPRSLFGIEILMGAELNIVDYEGHIDLNSRCLKQLDHSIASLHSPCIKHGSKEENTRALIKAMDNPYVDIIGHPDDGRYPVDYDAIVRHAVETRTLLEFNSASLNSDNTRINCLENMSILLEKCRKYKAAIILGSDAHFCDRIGSFDKQIKILKDMDFPDELIMNDKRELLNTYLSKYKNSNCK